MADHQNPLLVTGSYDRSIKFWMTTVPSWDTSKTIDIPEDQVVYRLKISADKKYLACATSKGIKLYDVTEESSTSFKGEVDYGCNCTAVGFRGDSEWLYGSGEDGTLRVHDIKLNGSEIVYTNDSPINDVVISHSNSELIAGDEAGRLIIYDLVARKEKVQKTPNQQAEIGIRSVAISSMNKNNEDKYICAADSSGCVYVWKITKPKEGEGSLDLTFFSKFQAHSDYILRCAISYNNT